MSLAQQDIYPGILNQYMLGKTLKDDTPLWKILHKKNN